MHKKLQFSFLNFLFFVGLLVLEGQSFAQTGETTNPTTNPTISSEGPAEVPQEEHNTEDLEKLLKKYNTDSEKILEDTSKLHNIQEKDQKNEMNDSEIESVVTTTEETTLVPVENVKGGNRGDKTKPLPSGLSSSVRMALEPLQQLSEAELLKRLDESTKQSVMRPYMDEFPNMTIFTVRLVRDKESIPSMVKIVENKDRLIHFGGVMLCTILVGVGLKRVMHREGRSFWRAAFYFLVRTYIMFFIRIGVVYYFFSEEFTPAAKIFKQTFMP